MKKIFENQTVVVLGASGGLGSAIAQAFAAQGAQLVLAGRRPEAMAGLAEELKAKIIQADLTSAEELERLAASLDWADVVVNATGYDVRKKLQDHSVEEIDRSLEVNLRGTILLTRAFLPLLQKQGHGTLVHLGGFADGRLAFPFYTVDVATRAGVYSFIEAVNRELEMPDVRVLYFSPSPADTPAERPYHPIWKEMGTAVVPPEQVAQELLRAVAKKQKKAIMGGFSVKLFAGLNAVWPGLADRLLLNNYRAILKRHLYGEKPKDPPGRAPGGFLKWLGIVLVTLSFVLYGGLAILPFLPFDDRLRLAAAPVLVATGEASFWIGGLFLGKELVTRLRAWFNPCRWWNGLRSIFNAIRCGSNTA
jgi:short-subunit dehydrogenase